MNNFWETDLKAGYYDKVLNDDSKRKKEFKLIGTT